jgi:hypothetical protein
MFEEPADYDPYLGPTGDNIYDASDEEERAAARRSSRQSVDQRSQRSGASRNTQPSTKSKGSTTTKSSGSSKQPAGYLGENGVKRISGCKDGEPFYPSSRPEAMYKCKNKKGESVYFNL